MMWMQEVRKMEISGVCNELDGGVSQWDKKHWGSFRLCCRRSCFALWTSGIWMHLRHLCVSMTVPSRDEFPQPPTSCPLVLATASTASLFWCTRTASHTGSSFRFDPQPPPATSPSYIYIPSLRSWDATLT